MRAALVPLAGIFPAYADVIVVKNTTYWGNIQNQGKDTIEFDLNCEGTIYVFNMSDVESFNIIKDGDEYDCFPPQTDMAGDGGYYEAIDFCPAYATPKSRRARKREQFSVVVQNYFNGSSTEMWQDIHFFDRVTMVDGRPVGITNNRRKTIRKHKYEQSVDVWKSSHSKIMDASEEENCSWICDRSSTDVPEEATRPGFCPK